MKLPISRELRLRPSRFIYCRELRWEIFAPQMLRSLNAKNNQRVFVEVVEPRID